MTIPEETFGLWDAPEPPSWRHLIVLVLEAWAMPAGQVAEGGEAAAAVDGVAIAEAILDALEHDAHPTNLVFAHVFLDGDDAFATTLLEMSGSTDEWEMVQLPTPGPVGVAEEVQGLVDRWNAQESLGDVPVDATIVVLGAGAALASAVLEVSAVGRTLRVLHVSTDLAGLEPPMNWEECSSTDGRLILDRILRPIALAGPSEPSEQMRESVTNSEGDQQTSHSGALICGASIDPVSPGADDSCGAQRHADEDLERGVQGHER